MMVLCCLLPIILVVGIIFLFGDGKRYGFWLIILLCPLAHIFMMRGHQRNNQENIGEKERLFKCPECGLKYQEKDWAEKCEQWCQGHKSCNLEIAKHAVKESPGRLK